MNVNKKKILSYKNLNIITFILVIIISFGFINSKYSPITIKEDNLTDLMNNNNIIEQRKNILSDSIFSDYLYIEDGLIYLKDKLDGFKSLTIENSNSNEDLSENFLPQKYLTFEKRKYNKYSIENKEKDIEAIYVYYKNKKLLYSIVDYKKYKNNDIYIFKTNRPIKYSYYLSVKDFESKNFYMLYQSIDLKYYNIMIYLSNYILLLLLSFSIIMFFVIFHSFFSKNRPDFYNHNIKEETQNKLIYIKCRKQGLIFSSIFHILKKRKKNFSEMVLSEKQKRKFLLEKQINKEHVRNLNIIEND